MTAPQPEIVAPRAALYYYDRQETVVRAAITPLQAWQQVMAKPLPGLATAFAIRDAISARFGVERIGGFSGKPVENAQVGDRLDFFLIEQLDAQKMTLTARDRHLSVMICVTCEGCRVAITASVIVHNWFGRVYMLPVAPAHRLIVWLMMRRLRAATWQDAAA